MNSKFDCPNKPGVNCKSLDQVNDMVDQGAIGKDISIKAMRSPEFSPVYFNKNGFTDLNGSLRSGEQVMKIWIAPYQDIHNNYHNESTIYTVVRKNSWTVPKEIKEC